MEQVILKESGKNKVKIVRDIYGLDLFIMRNGQQWFGHGVDDEILKMTVDAINDYFSCRHGESKQAEYGNNV